MSESTKTSSKKLKKFYFPVISDVAKDSLAEKAGIHPFDAVIQINGEKPDDVIDYRYLITDEMVIFELKTNTGKKQIITIEKEIDEDVGLEFFPMRCRTCSNKCIFCFIDQNPPGLRKELYIKDEDYRFSFLMGNYITLTSQRKKDFQKIKAKRLSPLYISVHAAEKQLRNKILGNPRAPDLLPIMKSFARKDIIMHTQIVLMPGINDGIHLDKTLQSLAKLFPQVASIAVVPVGLTRHRAGLPSLKPVTKSVATAVLKQIQHNQDLFMKEFQVPLVYAADEFYLLADIPCPPIEHYGSLEQIENGVGLVASLLDEYNKLRSGHLKPRSGGKINAEVICGTMIEPVLREVIDWCNCGNGIDLALTPVINRFFGKSVTVTGLLSGSDILEHYKNNRSGSALYIPDVMLKHGEQVFLDNLSIQQLSETLDRPITVFDSTLTGFLKMLTGQK